MPSAPSAVFFTDAPPIREGGIGGHILSYNLLQELGDYFSLVITRRLSRQIRRADIYRAPKARTVVFPDAPWLRPHRLRPWIELLLFLLSLPWLVRAVRRAGCQRIFALAGADPWFLPQADLLRRLTGLPLDLYLIDDFEESCRLRGQTWLARMVRQLEPRVLRQAARVFVISPGYAEHLASKYGQAAVWLPVLAQARGIRHSPYQAAVRDQRPIVFVGSINPFYLDGLCQLYSEISRWNRNPRRPYELRLRVLTRQTPSELLARLPDSEFLDLLLDLDSAALHAQLRAAWAAFLPYSFDPAMRVLVSTSFSHKFIETMVAGRPVLVFGPAYASLPRYFRAEGLPLCPESPAELAAALHQIEGSDNAALIESYRALIQRRHSADVWRSIVA